MFPGIGVGIGFSPPNQIERLVRWISGRVVWLRSDRGVALSSGEVATWTDTSVAGGLVATADASNGGITVGSNGAGGKPYLLCGQSGWDYLGFASGAISSLLSNAAEGFLVFRADAEPPASGDGGLHTLCGQYIGAHVPYTDGNVYDTFYTSARKTLTPSAGFSTVSACGYNPRSTAGSWAAKVNGVEVYSTATNTFSVNADNGILALSPISDSRRIIYFRGRFYEFLLFNKILSTTERSQVETYIRRRYATSW